MSVHTEQLGRKSTSMERMNQNLAFSLPNLTRYQGVPKRYEETRPVLIQGHAHRRILNIGHDLHRQTLDIAELEKLRSVRDAEAAVWAEAEQIKFMALQKADEEAALEQERVIAKYNKVHQKALKEEAVRVEMAMQKLAIEQVKQARMEGEGRLYDAIRQAEEKWRAELKSTVEKARKEERELAALEMSRVKKLHEEKFNAAMLKANEERKKALSDLVSKQDKAIVKAVADVEEREKRSTVEKIQQLAKEFEHKIIQLGLEIKEKDVEIHKREQRIAEVEEAKKIVESVFSETQKDFQDFIDRIQHFEDKSGQADYMLRPIYLDEIAKIKSKKPTA